jgi:hypothetical protein
MPDPRADPRLTLRVWGYGVYVHIALACLALLKQGVARTAGEVLGFGGHVVSSLSRMAAAQLCQLASIRWPSASQTFAHSSRSL